MVNLALLGAFIPTFLFVSVTPGMCMTLAMTLGMSQGVRRTLWMMWGEMLGVALVAILAWPYLLPWPSSPSPSPESSPPPVSASRRPRPPVRPRRAAASRARRPVAR